DRHLAPFSRLTPPLPGVRILSSSKLQKLSWRSRRGLASQGQDTMDTSTLTGPLRASAPLDLHGPIAADLEEVERVLARALRNRHARVAPVVDHVRHFRGK